MKTGILISKTHFQELADQEGSIVPSLKMSKKILEDAHYEVVDAISEIGTGDLSCATLSIS